MGKAAPGHPLGQATFDSQAWHCLDGADRGFLGLLFADPETPKSIHKDGALAEAHYNVTTTNLINSTPLSSTQTDTSETQIMSNSTEIECTYATCSVKEDGMLEYIPTLPGNAAYAGVFVALLVLHIFFGVKFRTWSFLVGMTCGNILEVAGYGGRILLHHNVFEKNYFIINLVGLTIGPAFLSASIYLCLARIIYIFGEKLSLLKPRVITYIFMACDSVSLVLQSAGGAITSMADDEASNQRGVDIMIAGLWSQVASLSIFMLLCAHFAWCTVRNPHKINGETIVLRSTVKFKCFLIGEYSLLPFPQSQFLESMPDSGCNSYRSCHHNDSNSIRFPTRRATRRLRRKAGQQRTSLHDLRGPNDHHCGRRAYHFPPWPCDRPRHVESCQG